MTKRISVKTSTAGNMIPKKTVINFSVIVILVKFSSVSGGRLYKNKETSPVKCNVLYLYNYNNFKLK